MSAENGFKGCYKPQQGNAGVVEACIVSKSLQARREFKRDFLYTKIETELPPADQIAVNSPNVVTEFPPNQVVARVQTEERLHFESPTVEYDLVSAGITLQKNSYEDGEEVPDRLNSSIIQKFEDLNPIAESENANTTNNFMTTEQFSDNEEKDFSLQAELGATIIETDHNFLQTTKNKLQHKHEHEPTDLLIESIQENSVQSRGFLKEESEHSFSTPNVSHRPSTASPADPNAAPCCSCKKSKCLKLYCECFARQTGCGSNCSCQDCYNKPQFEKIRKMVIEDTIEKNPLAFSSKFVENEKTLVQHTRGCNCRKTGCLKRYCECFTAGVPCTELCRCCTCSNNKTCPDNLNKPPRAKRISKNKKSFIETLIDRVRLMKEIEENRGLMF